MGRRKGEIKDGHHGGLEFYDLLIEPIIRSSAAKRAALAIVTRVERLLGATELFQHLPHSGQKVESVRGIPRWCSFRRLFRPRCLKVAELNGSRLPRQVSAAFSRFA